METADLNEVMIFTRVVEAQGFTAAAKLLGLPKSTVSRKVTQLEQRLGVPLLTRTTRRLHLTEPGAAYYESCARIVAQLDEAERAIRDQRATPKGTLRVTAPVDFALMHMGELVTAYLRKYPEVDIALALTSRRVDLVAEGMDVALARRAARRLIVGRTQARRQHAWFVREQRVLERARHAEARSPICPNTSASRFGREPRTVWKLNCGRARSRSAIKAPSARTTSVSCNAW